MEMSLTLTGLTIAVGLVFVGLPIWKLFWLAERYVNAIEKGQLRPRSATRETSGVPD
jgi:hypothetical protein